MNLPVTVWYAVPCNEMARMKWRDLTPGDMIVWKPMADRTAYLCVGRDLATDEYSARISWLRVDIGGGVDMIIESEMPYGDSEVGEMYEVVRAHRGSR